MKRAALGFIGFLSLAAVGAAWWLLRDTPEKALRDGMRALLSVKTARQVVADVSWTDVASRVTTGVGFSGGADLRELPRPRTIGVLQLHPGLLGPEEIADLIVEQDRFALRPRNVTTDWRQRYASLGGDPLGERFISILRDPFLDRRSVGYLIAHGSDKDLRPVLQAFAPLARPTGTWQQSAGSGFRLARIPFTLRQDELRAFLLSWFETWQGDNPTPDEIAWITLASRDLAKGSYALTVNRDTRQPVALEGDWTMRDREGTEIRRVRFTLELKGIGQAVTIRIPETTTDATDAILGGPQTTFAPRALKALPSSATSGPSALLEDGVSGTSSFPTAPSRFINEEEVDLWSKYMEELRRKKDF
ncbi:hypothetical protein HY479_01985 [Candidatus Uhrbacteria bacterium]|nr:hypothetical protein [Candidatus Uhrbacteria bacterium]